MTGATMCSGICAPEVAMPWVTWKWRAEVEPFPSAVGDVRHGTPNLGDITAADFVDRAEPVDLLVAGTPCQAFSVAGARRSLDDARGNLTLRFVEIVDAIRPSIVLWENVPGVLNVADNAFGCFLGALSGADSALVPARGQRWTDAGMVDGPTRRIAWRILDAQYFGLAQRRERVFVVACPRDGADPAEILFEREGLQRHSPPRREAGQTATGTISARTQGGGGLGTDFECQGGLVPEVSMCLNAGAMGRIDGESETFVAEVSPTLSKESFSPTKSSSGQMVDFCIAHARRAEGFDASEDGSGRGTPIVPVAFTNQWGDDVEVFSTLKADCNGALPMVAFSCKDHGADASDIAPTLRSMGHDGSHANGGGQVAVAFHENQRHELTLNDTAGSLKCNGGKPGQGYPAILTGAEEPYTLAIRGRGDGHQLEARQDGTANALMTPNGGRGGIGVGAVAHLMAVRRLTPVECERLQGFPDSYSAITFRGKPAADGNRYKALGNSMAVPVIAWIGNRIRQVSR